MKRRTWWVLAQIVSICWELQAQNNLSGYVKDSTSKEPLAGVNIKIYPRELIIQTNTYGYFSVVEKNLDSLVFSYVGYGKQLLLVKDIRRANPVVVLLKEAEISLNEVRISNMNTQPTNEIGLLKLSSTQIKQLPGLVGEKDLIKAVQMLPGVQKGAEGSTALYVRGGGADQNLLLLDEAVVYNPNHFFGLFSVFNADAINQVNFYKSGFPVSLGGRLSSVVDVRQKEGDKSRIKGVGSIGLLTSKISVEGPLKKNLSSFIVSARRTNLDPVLTLINSPGQTFKYRFYDINAKFSLHINPKNKVYVSGFAGDDYLRIIDQNTNRTSGLRVNNQSQLRWGNATGTLNWFSILNNKYSASSVLTYTSYNSRLADATTRTPLNGEALNINASFGSGIRDYTLKSTITKNTSLKRRQEFGVFMSRRVFLPTIFSSQNLSTNPDTTDIQRFGTNEIGVFVSEKLMITPKFNATYGLRYSIFGVLGKTYHLLEPRAALSFRLNNGSILKAAYDRNTQSVNLLQSSGFGLSTDLYVPSTALFRPQVSNQVSVGYETSLRKGQFNLTIESYLKRQSHLLNFREGVSLFLIGDDPKAFDWQQNITAGQGLMYGFEVGVRKPHGRLTGWISYTWAKAVVRFDELNNGLPFYPFQDRRHDLSVVSSLKLTRRLQLSANWILTTGFPITLPLGYYQTGLNTTFLQPANYYGSRNFSRMPTYHRLDISLEILPKRTKKFNGTWEFGVFNVYNRKNAFNAYLQVESTRQGSNLNVAYGYLLPIIPSITYHFKF